MRMSQSTLGDRLFKNAMLRPSGDQTGQQAFRAIVRRPFPLVPIVMMRRTPRIVRSNAIARPSGDHVGEASMPRVSRSRPLPSRFMIQMPEVDFAPLKASLLSSGDQAGSVHCAQLADLMTRRRSERSSRITPMPA
jgi:hypothetical protein